MFRHLYETAPLARNEYLNEEGVQLAERLVALQARADTLKEEIEKVKSALAAYAKRKGVEVVFTKSHKILIRTYDNIRFPGKNEPGRQALERVVKGAGKWEEVSFLDVFALSKVLQKGGWGTELVEAVKRFGAPEQSLWIKAFPRNGRRGG